MVIDMDAAAAAVDGLEAALVTHRGSAANWDAASEYVYPQSRGAPGSDGLVLRHVLPLPSAFVAQTSTYAYKSFMGLFPEIGRAWVSSDTRLVLWSYAEDRVLHGAAAADDFYAYEGFDQIIVTASLVRPRPGVFIDDVQYLIAVATTVEVTLLGVTFAGNEPGGQISLIPTNISVASDGFIMHKIVSSPDGRLFMGGSDGNVHEFVYYGETTGWTRALLGQRAAKRPKKLVHKSASFIQYLIPSAVKDYFSSKDEVLDIVLDASRNALYTLSTSGHLAVYDVSQSEAAHLIRSVDVAFEARAMLSYALPASEREFVAMFSVPAHMSPEVNLVVVSSFGERIYFACCPSSARLSFRASHRDDWRQNAGSAPGEGPRASPPVGSKRSAPDGTSSAGGSGTASMRHPTFLKCVGSRPTPIRDIAGTVQRPCIHMALWASGAVLLCDLREGDDDRVISVFPDPAPGRAALDTGFEGNTTPQRWSGLSHASGSGSFFGAGASGHGVGGGSGRPARTLLPPAGQLRPVETVFESTLGSSRRSAGDHSGARPDTGPGGPDDSYYARHHNGHQGETPRGSRRTSSQSTSQALHTLAIAEVQEKHRDGGGLGERTLGELNNLRLLEPPALFWVLTDRSMHLYEHAMPAQRLAAILASSSGGQEDQELELYFRHHGLAEASAFCLELAISDPSVAAVAARTLYLYGGRALTRADHPAGYSGQHGSEGGSLDWAATGAGATTPGRGSLQALRRGANPSFGLGSARYAAGFDLGRPSLREGPPASFSGVYEGLCIYLANALRPVWHEYICSSRDPNDYQRLALHSDTLSTCRERAIAFVTFLEQFDPETMLPWDDDESTGHRDGKESARPSSGGTSAAYRSHGAVDGHATSGTGTGASSHSHHQAPGGGSRTIQDRLYGRTGLVRMKKSSEARRAEVGAIHNIKQLAMRSSEALGFLSVLSDHQLHRIMPALQGDIREELARMQFCDLVARSPGATISTALIEVLFSGLSSVQDDLQPLCKLLQNVCPSYFDDDDMTLQNGLQRIRAAAELAGAVQPLERDETDRYGLPRPRIGLLDMDATGSAEREAAIRLAEEAVALLKPLASRIYNVVSVCAQVAAIGAVPSALELAIAVGDCAEIAGDQARTTQSYECAIELIEELVVRPSGSSHTEREGGPRVRDEVRDHGLAYNDDSGLSPEQRQVKDAALRVAFSSTSDSFLDMLYSSLAQTNEGQRELMVRPSAGLEKFLSSHQLRDLLWKYFARQGRHADAAGVLISMAEEDNDAPLMERLGYLSRALHNAKTAAAAGDLNAGTLESDVKDYLDVARVQLRIREDLSRRPSQVSDIASVMSELDSKILDLTVLYNEYAVPYGLLECTLDILRCGAYRDDKQVRSLWTKMIDSEIAESRSPALLEQKVVALGRDFYPSDVGFPTRFIVDLLERRTFEKGTQGDSATNGAEGAWSSATGWVTNAMVTIGVPLGEIVDAYRTMIENSSQAVVGGTGRSWSWTDEQSQLHVILATERALAAWAERAERSAGSYDMERRILVAESEKALRTVALCKSRLRGMSNARAKSLVQRFDKIEASLQLVENAGGDYF